MERSPVISALFHFRVRREVCPNFGQLALTSSFTKYKFFNRPSVLKMFQLSTGDFFYLCSSIFKMRKQRMTKLGMVFEVRAHYPNDLEEILELQNQTII